MKLANTIKLINNIGLHMIIFNVPRQKKYIYILVKMIKINQPTCKK